MFAEVRQSKILDIIQGEGSISVGRLSGLLDVSESTIRRDLQQMEEEGKLKRIHGGAIVSDVSRKELPFEEKKKKFSLEKEAIARAAAGLVQPGETISLDGGSTNLLIAVHLREIPDITVVTNSLHIMAELATASGVNLVATGGSLRGLSQALVGPFVHAVLEQLHVDKAFIGANGVTVNDGITTTDPLEAETKRTMLAQAAQVVVAADHSKIGKTSFIAVAPLARVGLLVTDWLVPEEEIAVLREAGLNVLQAEEKNGAK